MKCVLFFSLNRVVCWLQGSFCASYPVVILLQICKTPFVILLLCKLITDENETAVIIFRIMFMQTTIKKGASVYLRAETTRLWRTWVQWFSSHLCMDKVFTSVRMNHADVFHQFDWAGVNIAIAAKLAKGLVYLQVNLSAFQVQLEYMIQPACRNWTIYSVNVGLQAEFFAAFHARGQHWRSAAVCFLDIWL